MPFLTVIVPVRNEEKSLEATLRSLLTQDFPRHEFEVIVADGGSTDGTVPLVRRLQNEFGNVLLTYNPVGYSSGGRNLGARQMRGEALIVIDGHCTIPSRSYLREVSRAFAESGAACLGRPQPLTMPNPSRFQAAVAVARSSRLGHNPDSDIYSTTPKFVRPQSTAVAYRREVFERVGLFDEAFDACEDVEFNQRVDDENLGCYFTPAVGIVYHPRTHFMGLFRQLGRYGSGRARLARKHPHSLTLPALVPPAWVVWLVVGLPLAAVLPWFSILYLASIALYSTIILAGSIWLSRGLPLRTRVLFPQIFLAIHFGFAYGFLRELLRPRDQQ
ncbi:MAG: glycosyltransferase family 2 protein [Gemmataceae bacterium]